MITLTRLSGSTFVLNCDLIERVDSTPDTVISLIDGKKYVVAESLADIVSAVRAYRSGVVALSAQLGQDALEPAAEEPDVAPTRLAPVTVFPGLRTNPARPDRLDRLDRLDAEVRGVAATGEEI